MAGEWFVDYDWMMISEDGLVPPSEAVTLKAVEVAATLQAKGLSRPSAICPDGDGGIVFEWASNGCLEVVTILPDCKCEWSYFRDCKLLFRTVGLPPHRN
jgi:hypothetical protein